MKLNKKTRFVSVLIGLLLIGLIVYKFIEVDMKDPVIYFDNLPDLVNDILLYGVLALKILTVILISTGVKGALVTSIFLLAAVIGEAVFINLDNIKEIVDLFKAQSIDQFFNLLNGGQYIIMGLIASFILFWLFYTIFVISNALTSVGAKTILFLIGLAPLAIPVQLAMEDSFNIDFADPIYGLAFNVSMIFFISLMIMFSQRKPEKPKGQHVWFPIIETI